MTECIVSLSQRLDTTSIQPRFGDTKGWPALFSSEESSDLFYWVKLAFNQSNRHREVWIEGKSKHSTLSFDYFNCQNCSSSTGHLWNRINIYFPSYFHSYRLRYSAARESIDTRSSSSEESPFDCRHWFPKGRRSFRRCLAWLDNTFSQKICRIDGKKQYEVKLLSHVIQ